jgi:ABC-type histidine transport system ATPase subunit
MQYSVQSVSSSTVTPAKPSGNTFRKPKAALDLEKFQCWLHHGATLQTVVEAPIHLHCKKKYVLINYLVM